MKPLCLICLGAALLVAACASKPTGPYPSSANDPEAKQLFKAAGLDQIPIPDSNRSKSLFDVVGDFNPWVGLANATLTNSRSATAYTPAQTTHVIVWVPKSAAPDENRAAGIARTLVWDAAWEALTSAKLPEGMSPSVFEYGQGMRTLTVKGRGCDDADVRCEFLHGISSGTKSDWAPTVLGGAPSWRVMFRVGTTYTHIGHVEAPTPFFPDVAILQSMSAHLPAWVAIYVAPRTMAVDDDKIGRIFNDAPFVISEGKLLNFASP